MILEISKDERQLLLRLLILARPETASQGTAINALSERVMELRDEPVPVRSDGGGSAPGTTVGKGESPLSREASRDPVASPSLRSGTQPAESVRWSTEKFDREAVEQLTLTPAKIDLKESANGPYVLVSWPARGRGYLSAACWDEQLCPIVASRVKQETVFYMVHKGKYTNIVGVKA